MILTLPALWIGLQFDDYAQRATLLGLNKLNHPGPLGFLDVFSFLNGIPQLNDALKDIGGVPWWAPSDIRMAFMRHLSALSMWMDFKLWPEWPAMMHLHSILWYGALIIAAAALYRRFMGLTVMAGLAALFFALDYAHAIPVAWLANRYALISTFFGMLCLLSYDAWRRENRKWHGILSPVCLALALAAGEMAVATCAYLFAYALFLDGRSSSADRGMTPLARRLAALWPCAMVSLAWLFLYRWLGYGTHGSGLYIDPFSSPAEYARALITRAPLLLMGQWSHVSADMVGRFLSEKAALIRAGILMIPAAMILVPLLRKDRMARFWFTGMILSMAPVAATFASNRLLLFVGVGAMGLMAQCIVHVTRNDGLFPSSRLWRIPALIFTVYLILVRLVLSPPLLAMGAYYFKPYGDPLAAAARSVIADPDIARQQIILVNPPDQISHMLIWFVGAPEGKRPAGMRLLSGAPAAVEVTRIDEHSLRVKIEGGLFQGFTGRLFRSLTEDPIRVPQEFHVTGMTARVTAMTQDNGPEEIVYRFTDPLEDAPMRWLHWKDCGYQTFVLPPVGTSVRLPAFNPNDIFRNGCAGRKPQTTGES